MPTGSSRTNYIDGTSILSEALGSLERQPQCSPPKRVAIFRFAEQALSASPRSLANRISTASKSDAFEKMGLNVFSVAISQGAAPRDVQDIVDMIVSQEGVTGVIFQDPESWTDLLEISGHSLGELNVDLVTVEGTLQPAVVEAAVRLIRNHDLQSSRIAVVGSRGYVGRALISAFGDMGWQCKGVDVGDSSNTLLSSDVIVSAASQVNAVTPQSIKSILLAVDIGFIPKKVPGIGLQYFGNIHPDCYKKIAVATPVPGGMGPLQMLVLVERMHYKLTGEKIRLF